MSEPYGVTIFCDDIRQEISGKNTYVGVYQNVVIVNQEKPATLPMLSVAAVLVIPSDFEVKKVSYKLKRSLKIGIDEEIMFETDVDIDKRSREPGKILRRVIMFSMSPIEFTDDCFLASRAYCDDGKEIKMGVLAIKFKPLMPIKRAANIRPKPGLQSD